jgi:hypothetical protein
MRQLRFLLLLAVAAAATFLSSCADSGEKPAPVRTVNLGEKITLGHINYQTFETQWLTHIGEGADVRVPEHRYFLVRLQAGNGYGSELIVPNFVLEDDNGNTFPELNNGAGVPQYIGYLRSIKPNEFALGNAIFDAPPRHYKMKITDESGEKVGYVEIPLNFVSDVPDTPAEGLPAGKK